MGELHAYTKTNKSTKDMTFEDVFEVAAAPDMTSPSAGSSSGPAIKKYEPL